MKVPSSKIHCVRLNFVCNQNSCYMLAPATQFKAIRWMSTSEFVVSFGGYQQRGSDQYMLMCFTFEQPPLKSLRQNCVQTEKSTTGVEDVAKEDGPWKKGSWKTLHNDSESKLYSSQTKKNKKKQTKKNKQKNPQKKERNYQTFFHGFLFISFPVSCQ